MSGPGEPPSCQDLNSACSFTSSSYLPPHNNPGPQPPWSQVKSKELGGHHPQIGWYPIPTQNESLPKITFPSGNVITATTLAVRSRPFPCVHPKDWSGGWADPSAFLFWLHTASLLVGSGHQDALSSHLCPAVLLQAFWDIEKQTWLAQSILAPISTQKRSCVEAEQKVAVWMGTIFSSDSGYHWYGHRMVVKSGGTHLLYLYEHTYKLVWRSFSVCVCYKVFMIWFEIIH